MCGDLPSGWRAHQRGARGGVHVLLVVVLQHMMLRAYCPPPPPPFPNGHIHAPVPPCTNHHRPHPALYTNAHKEHKR
jgi:hypothetical protein